MSFLTFSAIVEALKEKGLKIAANSNGADPFISDAFSNSRQITPGSIFCCVQGEKSDGHQYISEAKDAGAVAILCERAVETDLPVILTESTRSVMGELASLVYGNPASKMLMLGVTGTNGKTTTTYILRSILQAAKIKTGLIGTIVESDGVREVDAERTTPESCDVQRLLATMVKNGCGACVMETSSHGLYIGRLDGCLFDVVIFTNLNPEHLDFHGTMENYFQAKRLLFTKYSKKDRLAAINADDAYGARLLEEFPDAKGFSMSKICDLQMDRNGSSFKLNAGRQISLTSPLVGNFNVANVLSAVSALRGRVCDAAIVRGVSEIPQVPGRLEKFRIPNGACCIIDFAHTPEALRNVLSAARNFCSGRLISVFGHGGGRYQSNRPALGEAAASLADLVLVTMDNPRDEDPAMIADGIVHGIEKKISESGRADKADKVDKEVKYKVILDRKEAIATALSIAGPEDVLVISGKGPEKFLTIKDQKIPYSDAGAIEEWLQAATPQNS